MEAQEMRLRYYPDPVLQRRAQPIETIDERVREGVRRMFEIMYENGGIGLAGPQVGWDRRVFVINLSGEAENTDEEQVFINPAIAEPEGSDRMEEGCLSFPGIRIDIERPEKVQITATNLEGEAVSIAADELLARCAQHELDHLDGILFTTRVSRIARMKIRKELKELEQQFQEESH